MLKHGGSSTPPPDLLTTLLLRKKIERGPFVSSGFVGYVKKVKNERGDPFALISADRTWPLMLVVLVVSIVRKVAQSE